ncbi:YciI family protein [Ramlibacter tataouinensis]|uniref:YCII-related domain-containing protein n=1 Tax=Ramlibacter tataouinensis (strain ATCC BAA-407 / DSM 14655 / LMG 21543 / TTB310) TaxID=365046 RepID=F5XZ17_RAMTT|nr:YciI family protein [Ramlibacter tataouinensis]AEG92005.1 Conserved hypothetical protein [Ramlibacter tataouinensis TTB310]
MAYMLLIHEPVGQRALRSEAEGHALYERMLRFRDGLRQRGLLVVGESLASQDAQAAQVRVQDGKARVLDGPFAEAKEMVGGFFLLNCESREQALAVAAECPAAAWATVEVRAVAPCYR